MLTKQDSTKFPHLVDEIVYHASLLGVEDETGGGDTRWVGLLDGPVPAPEGYELSAEDLEFLADPAFIIQEDSAGFVNVTAYESREEALRDFEGFQDEDEDEDEEDDE